MLGGFGDLVIEKHLFEQLLSGAHTREFNLDIRTFFETREADHVSREIHNLHRLAHIEHEQLATTALGPSLQNKLHGLGNRHEIATHVRMCHGHWAAVLNLAQEGWN